MPPKVAKLEPPSGAPCPADLGAYLLTRLTALETHSARLQQKAEAAGDHKPALLALRLNFRILLAMANLARQFPQAAQTWQAPVTPNPPPPMTASGSSPFEAASAPAWSPNLPTGGQQAPPGTSKPIHPKCEPLPDTRLRPVNADW